jgi:hypothetical protein
MQICIVEILTGLMVGHVRLFLIAVKTHALAAQAEINGYGFGRILRY